MPLRRPIFEIGKLYYAEKGTAPEGGYAAACEKITAARAAIETNNDRIAQLKATEDDEPAEPEVQPEAAAQPQEQPADQGQENLPQD